ncbi:MAG: hypothetical protein CL912_19245 [Deltaproteobacteria bacterium]|nr:hypothetical protein [Deltaproteobacteria bacterium]
MPVSEQAQKSIGYEPALMGGIGIVSSGEVGFVVVNAHSRMSADGFAEDMWNSVKFIRMMPLKILYIEGMLGKESIFFGFTK